MILNENNKQTLNKLPGIMKRGFNQTPDDIRDRINYQKKQMANIKKQENKGNVTNQNKMNKGGRLYDGRNR